MPEAERQRHGRWRLDELLLRYLGLRIVPSGGCDLVLAGELQFLRQGPSHGPIQDAYAVEIRVPPKFPNAIPSVREVAGRIPKDFHKLEGDLLCLAAPTELRLKLMRSPTLPAFVEGFVIPYLFGHSYFVEHGSMPFGELAHGSEGIRQYLGELFGAPATPAVVEYLRLASMKKRDANKRPCPCNSGRRLGRCHGRRVNLLRDTLGRRWFQDEYARMGGVERERRIPRR